MEIRHNPTPMRSPISIVDVDRLDTWSRYRAGLCDTCAANCCTMPLEVQLPDLVRLGLVDAFEAEHEEPRQIAKRLQKARLIDHFNHKNVVFTMARRASGDCNFLHPTTRLCTVYEQRPDTCRLHPQKKSPKPGFCAYGRRAARVTDSPKVGAQQRQGCMARCRPTAARALAAHAASMVKMASSAFCISAISY